MQKTGLSRNIIDKYYTKQSIVNNCLENIKKHINIEKTHLIIEPSAGNGAFINGIKELSDNCEFLDISPEHLEIKKCDYLDIVFEHKSEKVHIIGNPPFGRQSSLVKKFIKKSCEIADTISFILPKSFKKNSMQKCFNSYFHLIYQEDLPDLSFLVNTKDFDVPCIFQIWEKKDHKRLENIKENPKNFQFVKKTENPDISFRRVGFYAGKISLDIEKNEQSHYFIKFTKNTIDENINKLLQVNFDKNNTVGPKSISKQEIIREFNKML